MSKSCIRVYADVQQINQCKQDIASVQDGVSSLSRGLSLAGNEARLKILYLLHRETEMCPCDLSDVLDMTVPAISQHLRKLKDADMVMTHKVGQTVFYSLANSVTPLLDPIFDLIQQHKQPVS